MSQLCQVNGVNWRVLCLHRVWFNKWLIIYKLNGFFYIYKRYSNLFFVKVRKGEWDFLTPSAITVSKTIDL